MEEAKKHVFNFKKEYDQKYEQRREREITKVILTGNQM